jgi:hypothetical protein
LSAVKHKKFSKNQQVKDKIKMMLQVLQKIFHLQGGVACVMSNLDK